MKLIIILALTTILYSCGSQRNCYPSKRSKDYAIKQGIMTNNCWKTTLISVKPTMKGFKHLFVTEQNDTIIRFDYCPLTVGECYYLVKGV